MNNGARKRRAVDGLSKSSGRYAKVWPEMQVHNLQQLRPAPGTDLNKDRDVVRKTLKRFDPNRVSILVSTFRPLP